MQLSAYLDRIGFKGPVNADLAGLKALHRAHLLAIPYENLDVQLGRTLTTAPAAAYEKIVGHGRGGWCYEMNGLFGWALAEAGFSVRRLCTGPMRPYAADRDLGNHLVIRVDLEETWLADVGYGDGPIEPFRLVESVFTQRGLTFRLERLADGWWRLHNHQWGMSPSYDFNPDLVDEDLLSARCVHLNSSPESPFILNLVAFRHTERGLKALVGRKVRGIEDGEPQRSRLLNSADELEQTLAEDFAIRLPEGVRELWPRVVARHEELFGTPA